MGRFRLVKMTTVVVLLVGVAAASAYGLSGAKVTAPATRAGGGAPAASVAAGPPYFVFVLTNVALPGNIWIGQVSDLAGKNTCAFVDGGLCANAGGADVPVTYTENLGPFDSCAAAFTAYNQPTLMPHPAFGGTKVYIFGGSYFIDNMAPNSLNGGWCTPGTTTTTTTSSTTTGTAPPGGCAASAARKRPYAHAAAVVTLVSISSADPELVDVTVIRADGSVVPATPGMTLCQGDRIKTGFANSATLDFGGRATVVIEQMTEVRMSTFNLGEIADVELWLKGGGIAAQVTKNAAAPNSFRVKSPTLTASVRGTAFSVSYDPRTGASIVDVRQDSVDVLPTKGPFSSPVPDGLHELILTAGKEVQVSATTESAVAAIGHAGAPAGAISRSAAIGLVERVVSPNVGACKLKATALSAAPARRGWTVSVSVSTTAGGGWATFTIRGSRIANKNALATKIAHGCRRH